MIQADGIFVVGAKEPYTEETFDSSGNLIAAKLHGYTVIRSNMFNGSKSLKLENLSDEIESIGNAAFINCQSIEFTKLPSRLTVIKRDTFENCILMALTSLPTGLTSIENYGFKNCPKIAITRIPAGVKSIGADAFYNGKGLTSLTFAGTPTTIDSTAFSGCINLKTINVPWAEGAVANAPWGATNATINYNYTGG